MIKELKRIGPLYSAIWPRSQYTRYGIGETVKQFETRSKSRPFFMALLLAGCAGSLQGSLVAQTAPSVIFTNPNSDAMSVPTSINSSKNIVTATAPTATFSQPMNPATVDSLQAGQQLTFTLVDASGNNVPGTADCWHRLRSHFSRMQLHSPLGNGCREAGAQRIGRPLPPSSKSNIG